MKVIRDHFCCKPTRPREQIFDNLNEWSLKLDCYVCRLSICYFKNLIYVPLHAATFNNCGVSECCSPGLLKLLADRNAELAYYLREPFGVEEATLGNVRGKDHFSAKRLTTYQNMVSRFWIP